MVSHSNCAKRQQEFWKSFSKYADVLVVSPMKWGNKEVKDELFTQPNGNIYRLLTGKCYNEGDMNSYYFDNFVYNEICNFNPDIIYQQNEVYSNQAFLSQSWAKSLGAKYVLFCWENIRQLNDRDKKFLENCDLVICGSEDSRVLYKGNLVLPQVGIDTNKFKSSEEKRYDVLYLGRYAPEKGVAYIKAAYPDTTFICSADYEYVPEALSKAKIFVSYPFDISQWKEQWISYSVAEAMASGCAVIMSDTSSAKEYLKDSPVILVPMQREDLLKEAIYTLLQNDEEIKARGKACREWVKQFDNDIMSKKLYEIFKVLINDR